MDWKEFEGFVESAFSAFGFRTQRNARFRKPRVEIDLVACKDGLTFAVDCKHWKRTVGHASMVAVSNRQIVRALRLVEEESHLRVIPLVVTLHNESLRILENGVPIVPIHMISDFILNWEDAFHEIVILSNENSKMQQKKLE
ncbi:MAG: restriction endonuclease [Nitrososphaerales archaeon]